jgi:molybdopterin-guanine dinucleotide biosynthesis protein A
MSISAVLLAGGESKRMGRDKATLLWRDRPLWQWQLEKLRALRPGKILLSARSDVNWRPANVDLVLDSPPSRGPLSGLAAALAATETEHLLALGIDMPFMMTEHLHYLSDLAIDGIGVVPMIDGKAEPLCAIYPKGVRREFLDALRGDDFSLQPVIRNLIAIGKMRPMPVPDAIRDLYRNINEPQDLE